MGVWVCLIKEVTCCHRRQEAGSRARRCQGCGPHCGPRGLFGVGWVTEAVGSGETP